MRPKKRDAHHSLLKQQKKVKKAKNAENQLVQACRDRNMVHAYVNTPATAKRAIVV